jgi:hypothetical protein
MLGSTPSGRSRAAKVARAISWIVLTTASLRRMLNLPAENSISSGGASSIAEAITLALPMTFSQAPCTRNPRLVALGNGD